MGNILNHLKFLLTATNQHGVHSPFVYNYVTKCLYAPTKYSRKKSQNILFNNIAYFKAKRVWLPSEKENIQKSIQHEFPWVHFENEPYDLLFANPPEAESLLHTTSEESKMHSNSILLVDDIYANPDSISLWENLKNHPSVSVTVDMYYCGAAFFRKEQAKEHFKIRI